MPLSFFTGDSLWGFILKSVFANSWFSVGQHGSWKDGVHILQVLILVVRRQIIRHEQSIHTVEHYMVPEEDYRGHL